jgi:hypothetical protein
VVLAQAARNPKIAPARCVPSRFMLLMVLLTFIVITCIASISNRINLLIIKLAPPLSGA